MHKSKKFRDPWAPASARLKRKAKQEGWPSVSYYENGYRYGYFKKCGSKWSQIITLGYRKKKIGDELDTLTRKIVPVYKSKYVPVTKRILNTHVKHH